MRWFPEAAVSHGSCSRAVGKLSEAGILAASFDPPQPPIDNPKTKRKKARRFELEM
jgi:hypothetical protein